MLVPNRHGSSNSYRYGFNGMEKDDEISGEGNSYTAEFWQYDPRVARRWNIDPVVAHWESPYAAFRNNPILLDDPNGDCPDCGDPVKKQNISGGDINIPEGSTVTETQEGKLLAFKTGGNEYWFDPSINWYSTLGNREIYDPTQFASSNNAPRYVKQAYKELKAKGGASEWEIYLGKDWARVGKSSQQSEFEITMIASKNIYYATDFNEVGIGESFVPVWGNGRKAYYDIVDGEYYGASLSSIMMLTDLYGLGSLKNIGKGKNNQH